MSVDRTKIAALENSRPLPRHPINESRYYKPVLGVMSIMVLIIVWQLAVSYFGVPYYVLPQPTDVLGALIDGISGSPWDRGSFWYHWIDTLRTTIFGYLIGCGIGVALAALMAQSRFFQGIFFPYVVILQSLPKIAIAPLFIIWFGYQIESKIAMAATLTLFPVLLNSMQGFSNTDRERLEVMKALKANEWQTFWYVKLPSALPLIFAGLNLGIVYAQLGAIVSEFVGAQRGMGVLITQLQTIADTAGVFAVLVMLAVTGYLLITLTRAIHRHVVFWDRGSSKGSSD
jgi:NitT/TauT family transport system permease protein